MKAIDIAFALLATVISVVGSAVASRITHAGLTIDVLGLVLAAGAGMALIARRRWPLVSLGTTTAFTTLYLTLNYPYGPVVFTFLAAVYAVGRYEPLSKSVPVAVVSWLVFSVHLLTNKSALPGLYGLIPVTGFVLIPLALGVIVRANREAFELARAEAIRERVSNERLRVAQEVHDVVGHGLAAIKMQADIALHLLTKKPEQAEIALKAISQTSTEALDELRATLTVVRGRAPAPGLGLLPDLTDRMSHAGVEVKLNVVGTQRDLPAAVNLAGYRVVQESLTNVLKHSSVKRATVRVGYEPGSVRIKVSNPSSGPVLPSAGFGIPGMRERVTALGGEFSAGPTEDGLFEVRATIPTDGDSQ
ncbi:signal transduction histidine kinase [Kibdelosporangium banguiense]|uniref:histidine kinase n=1 Tax=Kibdelosporangium banguiense TaxID=1365924 RepID=A0ABS4TZH5_9PSEU|nr:sensor histidine kinase [Kibdelosporangium banguiense]MBP2329802.1 signal transduction histidine kinase [Kibdelosporangium banguiense]